MLKFNYPTPLCPRIKLLILLISLIQIKHANVMEYQLLCLNCVLLRFLSPFIIAWILAHSLIVRSMSSLFTKKITAKLRLIIGQVYAFLNAKSLLSKNQSGFRPGDSTIYQLLSITSNIYEAFKKYDETRYFWKFLKHLTR